MGKKNKSKNKKPLCPECYSDKDVHLIWADLDMYACAHCQVEWMEDVSDVWPANREKVAKAGGPVLGTLTEDSRGLDFEFKARA